MLQRVVEQAQNNQIMARWFVLALLLSSCAAPLAKKQPKHGYARATLYNSHEDKYGNKVAMGGRAKEGITIAAENGFPFRTKVYIPCLNGILGNGCYEVQDRGRFINSRKASHGKTPVFDFFVKTKKRMKRFAKKIPQYVEYYLQ